MLKLLLLLLLTSVVVCLAATDDQCFEGNEQCHCYETTVSCFYFNQFSALDFTKNNLTTKISQLTFGPYWNILDRNFSLAGIELDEQFNVTFDRSFAYDLSANPFAATTAKGNTLELRTLTIDFMYEHKFVNTSQDCDQLLANVSNTYNMFSSFDRVLFPQAVFPQTLCPAMFANARLEELYVDSQQHGSSKFEFFAVDPAIDLNCTVKHFTLSGSHLEFNTKFLHKDVLREMQTLVIRTTAIVGDAALDEFLFQPFRKLKFIEFDVEWFSELLKPPTKWLRHLNVDVNVDLSNRTQVELNRDKQMLIVIRDYTFDYHFDERDLCRFYYYPHHKLVFTKVIATERPTDFNCTCPLLWVLLHWKLYNGVNGSGNSSDLITSATERCLNVTDAEFDRMVANCQFAARFQNCTEFQTDSTLPPSTTITTQLTTETSTTAEALTTQTEALTTTKEALTTQTEALTTTETSTTAALGTSDQTSMAEHSTTVLAESSTQETSSSPGQSSTTRDNSLAEKLKESDRQISTLSVVVGVLGLFVVAFLALSVLVVLKTRRQRRSMHLLYRLTTADADDESADFTAAAD